MLALDSSVVASIRFSARVQRAGYFLLLAQEKANYCAAGAARTAKLAAKRRRAGCPESRECAPDAALPSAVRDGMPGFVERTSLCVQPCACNELARIVRAPLRAFPTCPRHGKRGPEDHEQDQERPLQSLRDSFPRCAGEAKIFLPLRAARGKVQKAEGSARASARRSALLRLSGSPLHCGGSGRRGPAGVSAMDRAHSVACTRTCSQRNPAADADPARRTRAGRNALGRVSLLTFSARAEKVSRSSIGRVEALAFKSQIMASESKIRRTKPRYISRKHSPRMRIAACRSAAGKSA